MSVAAPALPHESIRASAGSGKTYQLVIRYLRLIATGVAPANILASTFTRLAAGEIRDRILMRLAEAVDDPKKRAVLARDLDQPQLSSAQVLAMLITLARQLHRMNVRTLDSFFAGVVRSFAFELNVPPNADVIDENQAAALRAEALQLLLDEREPQKLIDLLRLLTQDSSERSVMGAMDSVIRDLFEIYRETGDEPWDCFPRPRTTDVLGLPQVVSAIQALEACSISPDKKALLKAWVKDCDKARAHDWEAFAESGIGASVARGKDKYGNSTIPGAIVAAYEPLARHARAVIINRIADQTIATRDLLKLFSAHDERRKHRQEALTFADVTHAMRRAEKLDTMQDIGFRLDARLHHLLLDEFQDTSIPQWRALEPIVHELVSNAPPQRTFFCVGDVKQSIYTWRQAAPEVLDELPQLLRGDDGTSAITERSLATSYRSSQVVIDAVNRVFGSLEHNQALTESVEAASLWMQGFERHSTAKTDLAGHVQLHIAPRAKKDDEHNQKQKKVRLQAAADFIAKLHRDNPAVQIAVLTRTNPTIARLMFELGRRGVPCSGRGGGPLTDAAPVNAILDLLQLADHPDDTIAAFNVATSPLGSSIGLTNHAVEVARHRIARQVREDLINDGYAMTIAKWVTRIISQSDAREARRLLQLVELAGQYDDRATLRTRDFISVVEQTVVPDPQAAPVQVMTIHQSKGLEFDAVVLPELDGGACSLAGRPAPVVFEREGATGPIKRICRWMSDKTLELMPGDSRLREMFDHHRLRTVRESLCLLYVAITRARQGLYMIIDPPRENERTFPKTMAGVVRDALVDGTIEPATVAFELGDADWARTIPQATPADVTAIAATQSIAMAKALSERDTVLLRGFAAQAASAAHGEDSLARQLMIADDQSRERGTAIHAMFQAIEWLDGFTIDEQKLIGIARFIAPRRGEAWAVAQLRDFGAMIQKPAIRTLLTKPSTSVEVHREVPFTRIVDGNLQRGSIDRLVIDRTPGQPVRATIIDYKTDAIEAAQAAVQAELHREQLHAYRAAAAEVFSLDPKRISLKIAFIVPAVVIDITACH